MAGLFLTSGQGQSGKKPPQTPVNLVSSDHVDQRVNEVKVLIESLKNPLIFVITAVVLALVLGFYSVITSMQALVVESNNFKTSAYQRIEERVNAIETEICSE